MSDEAFPVEFIDFGYRAGPEWRTTIVRTHGGYEQRNADWDEPLFRFVVPLSLMESDERTELLDFVNARQGAFDSFLFTDPVTASTFRCRFRQDTAQIETRFFQQHFWPDLEIVEVRDED